MSEQSSASVLKISDAKTMQLIDLYSNEDCLFNTKSEDYKNREKRTIAAEKIATILDLPNFTAKHVLMKFKNLRNSYSQELKKINNSIKDGATGEDIYAPRVFWYSKMDAFIKPHLQGKGAKDEALRKRLIAKKSKVEVTEQKSVFQSLKDIESHLHVLVSHNDDYHDTFGKYVASLLRSLPPQTALSLQPKIVSLITSSGIDCEGPAVADQSSYIEEMIIKIDRDDSD
ncbi:Uncharacterized protein OBRU01_15467 [Operophtera brumata]|uniref:MADF domain-containing protein n=1 Tax=Operophtera brumata TaxID=104452 RepID=A0A0L7L4D2_OPEBR|nr:Uncharacterized protein OBRU01_15467 [Operophtera brumata]